MIATVPLESSCNPCIVDSNASPLLGFVLEALGLAAGAPSWDQQLGSECPVPAFDHQYRLVLKVAT